MANPSYYFTLFKKFQVINHVPGGSVHGSASPTGGFDLKNPNSVFGSSNRGPLLGATTNPSDSPLWAVLNAKAIGSPNPTIAGTTWPAMPQFATPAWNDFQVNALAPKLVDVFGSWINAGKVNDIPTGVIASMPPAFAGPDPGVVLFVCSMPGDTGVRPGVPSNFWATSLIFLVDPNTGSTVSPSTLTGASEYYLAAIIGNRGNTDAGRYINPPAVEAAASVMVWNTVDSPGVQLPSLSNLDVSDKNGIYDEYFLKAGHYDVVGFRMNVQTVYNGIIAALNDALVNNPNLLGGLTPDQWVHAQPAHLCAKVVVREQGTSFPNFGDTPDLDRRLAQKNLAPFDINLTATDPAPNINWKNFIVGQPLFLRLPGAGRNTLTLETKLPPEGFRLYIAIPKQSFERFFREGQGGFKGFKLVPHHELCEGKLGELAKPFPEAVILQHLGKENALEIPPLADGQYLGMSLGIEYNVKRLKHGPIGEVTMVHNALLPKLVAGTRCFEIEQATVGGFTIIVRAFDPTRGPKG